MCVCVCVCLCVFSLSLMYSSHHGCIGVPAGTVVITNRAFNGLLNEEHEIVSRTHMFMYICIVQSRVMLILCSLIIIHVYYIIQQVYIT